MKKFNKKEKGTSTRKDEETVIINTKGSTYADLLQKMKDITNIQIDDSNVKGVKNSNKRDLVITMTKNSREADKLM